MFPTEVRTELLAQHERLRRLATAAEAAARSFLRGGSASDLRQTIADLRQALADHNALEESVLEPILRGGDAFGSLRVERMIQEHRAEHTVMFESLDGDDLTVAELFPEFVEELIAHMAAEERTFLHPHVLKGE
jgi:iron-sulfur cluster repair protein YtfE (RIC family)